jgi:hypothetical protein
VTRDPQRPTVPQVLPLVRAYVAKPGNGAGGSLHILLDDGNIEDGAVRFCLELAMLQDDADGVALAKLLLAMTKTQRGKLCRLRFSP